MVRPLSTSAGSEAYDKPFGNNPEVNQERQVVINALRDGLLSADIYRQKMEELDNIEKELAQATIDEERARLMIKLHRAVSVIKKAA